MVQSEQDNVFVGRTPDLVIVGLVDSRAYNGDLRRYSFAFQKFGVTRVRQTVDGEECPFKALEMAGNTMAEDLLSSPESSRGETQRLGPRQKQQRPNRRCGFSHVSEPETNRQRAIGH